MKEINILILYDENQFGVEIKTKGFNETNGPINTLEIIGVLESIKQQELKKLVKEIKDE
ncbi:MAG TPA: hypothetical protein VMZ91_00775 [Candidatus Paceibacterota bacterium]|nr:hypothetical protein [Candidatus Paceibacterota bacterium]